jgi:membrane protein
LVFAEKPMRPDIAPDRHANLRGWNLAAALGLLAIAFVVEQIAPAENKGLSERTTERSASALSPPVEAGDRGRLAASPSEIPAKGWKDILLRSIPTSENTAFWPWPPA